MMSTLTRNVVMVCSLVMLCAALVGCSSDDGKSVELERQLGMVEEARMTAEQERDTAKAAQTAAEAAQMAAEQAQAAAAAARTMAEQERDAAKAAQMTAEQAQAAAGAAQMAAEQARIAAEAAEMMAEQERDGAKAAQMMAEQAQAAAEAAQMAAEQARATAEAARMMAEQERDDAKAAQAAAETDQRAAEQALADAQFDAAVANAIEKVVAYDLRRDNTDPEDVFNQERTTGRFADSEAWLDTGYQGAVVLSQVYRGDGGEYASRVIPWHGDGGQVEFFADVSPEGGTLQRDPNIYPARFIFTDQRNTEIDGVTTTVESHDLGLEWQGFEAMKAYDGGGTLKVRFFTDLEESGVQPRPFGVEGRESDWEYEYAIFLNDPRVPAIPAGRDGLFIEVPVDGLRGSLNGNEGTFSCAPGNYCALYDGLDTSAPGYLPWDYTSPILFTRDGASEPEEALSIPDARPVVAPKVNYLSFGSWLYIPEDVTDIDAFNFGLFASGDDPFVVSNLMGLAGTSTYAGRATGMYGEMLRPETGSFSADVELTADFGSDSEFGTMAGMVSNFELDRGESPLKELHLRSDIRQSWGDEGPPYPGGSIVGNTAADGGWWGEWGGKFFGNGITTTDIPPSYIEHPTSFAGTFGATDGERSFAGSFGAHKQ